MPTTQSAREAFSAVPFCAMHGNVPAQWICTSCQQHLCGSCIKEFASGLVKAQICNRCGGRCAPVFAAEAPVRERASFVSRLPGAFSYPFKAEGLVILGVGTVFFWVLDFASILKIVALFATGYLCAFMMKVVSASAGGASELPEWPGFSDWFSDIVVPYFQVLATGLFSFLPAIAWFFYRLRTGVEGSEQSLGLIGLFMDPVMVILIMGGLIYFPMSLLAVSMFESIKSLNPLLIIPSILKVPKDYAIACVALFAAVGIGTACEMLAAMIPFVGSLIVSFLSLYFIMVEMRILGLLYHANEKKLAWFDL